ILNGKMPLETPFMETTVTLDRAGRVVIPNAVRDEMHLKAGDALALHADGETVSLRPVRASNRMRKKRGVWVFSGGQGEISAEDVRKVIHEMREDRERRWIGQDK